MIVKDESHVILDTLKTLVKHFKFDRYDISDTGSSDDTKEKIASFFNTIGIPGDIYDDPWKDFGHNRTRAFEHAYGKTDYALVWDADDSIVGTFTLPEPLTHDSYLFTFGPGTVYSRAQLFNNHKKWRYVGVLHEYPACCEESGPPFAITGAYHFISGKTGNRSKDPNKYLKDALVLEKAFHEAYANKDPIYNRYAYYTAQSYNSCNKHDKAIEFYKKVLTLDNWIQEKYVSCFEIYDQYELLKQEDEGLRFLVMGHRFDPRRVECIYRLVKYYCIKGQSDVAMAYYSLIQNYYENEYVTDNISSRLFAKKIEYDFYLPYYMIIVSGRVNKRLTAVKMYSIIFRKAQTNVGKWWIDNLFTNLQFSFPTDDATFVDDMLAYVYTLRNSGIQLSSDHYTILDKVIAANRKQPATGLARQMKQAVKPIVMLTITTCKRLNLFEQTMISILRTWKDIDKIDYFFCVDDNSSAEDRASMQSQFPFFNYYMKSEKEKGHRESMNIIWNKLRELTPTYWIHLEDDWQYLTSEHYVSRGIALLDKYENQKIHQLVFNREYGLMLQDMDRTSGVLLERGVWLHTQTEVKGRNCAYWPHYSMQPSIVRTSTILSLGNYDSANTFFERDYANKYAAAGYKTMFFDGIFSLHIGKQHWEKDGMNAYALNEQGQFAKSEPEKTEPEPEPEKTEKPEPESENPEPNGPLLGTMREHLEQILYKIQHKIPFGLIRPSDGEHHVLSNKTLTNCDKWTFKAGGILQKQLLDAIQTVDPNLYVGIPCNTCNAPWNCTQKIYNDYTVNWKVPLTQRTYANLFMGANWKPFTNFLLSYKRLYVVTSGTRVSTLPIQERCIIDDKLVNTWDTEHEKETARIMQFIKDKKGELFCFSAGPLSKYWIPLCMKQNPHNMYVDVGATLDIFTKGSTNRQYTEPNSRFANDVCRFEPFKNLVYMCVFHNATYLDLLSILMITVKMFSRVDTIDFLVFTSAEFVPKIQRLSESIGIPIHTHVFAFTTQHEAGCARLYLYDYPYIAQYEKILYIDTDIIVQNDLTTLFTQDIEDKIYALGEDTIDKEWMGGWYFDFTTIDRGTPGMNSGILLFKNRPFVRTLFHEIRTHVNQMKETNNRMPMCLDQPFINFHIVRNAKQDTTLLKPYAQLFAKAPPPFPTKPTENILCHFAWPLGAVDHKRQRMLKYMSHVFNHYSELYPSDFKIPQLRTKFTWGTGYIEFHANGISTSWGAGTYKWLDSHTVNVTWRSYSHVLRMNADYTSFLSVRLSDFVYNVETQVRKRKNLVYMCVFHNEAYIQLLKILLASMKLFSKTENMEILVFTNAAFTNAIHTLYESLQIAGHIHTFAFTTFQEAGYARLHIFEYPSLHLYDTILYLDTDIIVQNDVSVLFQMELENKLYALPEGTIEHEYHGGWYFDFTKVDKNTQGMNSGILLFRNTAEIRQIFADVLNHIHTVTQEKARMPACLDQAFINYHTIKNGMQNVTLLAKYACIYAMDPPPPPSEPTDIILCHFVWPIGNAHHKRDRMLRHMEHIFNHYTAIYGPCTPPSIQRDYRWGDYGGIQLKDNELLTTWGRGTYKWLSTHVLEATWRSYSHILCMNAEYTSFFSVRKNDFDLICGKEKLVIAAYDETVPFSGGYGDRVVGLISCKVLSGLLNRDFKIHWVKENIEPYFNYSKYKYKEVSTPTVYNLIDNDNVPQTYPESNIKLYVNHDICKNMYSDSKYYTDMLRAYSSLYTDIFALTPSMQQMVNKLVGVFGITSDPIIGIQIRAGDSYIKNIAHNKYTVIADADTMIPAILTKIREHIEKTYATYTIFLTSDYDNIYAMAQSIWKRIIYIDSTVQHLDRNNQGDLSKIFMDNYILSQKTHRMYISEYSNYGRVAALSSTHSNIYNLSCAPLRKETLLSKKNKGLLYFSVLHNKDYFRLAALLLKSIRFFSTTDAFDILLITQAEFKKEAEELAAILPIKIHYMSCTSIFQAACARLRIFEYPDIWKYQTILYLDTDIIIKKDLSPLFSEPLEDVLYGLECGTITSNSFGRQFFNFATIDGNTTGMNSGTLMFNTSDTIRALFARINAHIAEYKDTVPYTMDQPFINYHAIKDKLYNNTFLKTHVSLYEGETVDNYDTSTICHFSFPIGNSGHKYNRMAAFMKRILHETGDVTTQWATDKRYHWNSQNSITFCQANILKTPWKNGTYEYIDNDRIKATWGIYEHVLRFDTERKTGISIRTKPDDFEVVTLT